MSKRAMLFIDAQNLENSAKEYYGEPNQIDYIEFVNELTDNYDLIRPYFFDSFKPEVSNKQNFYYFLKRELGFRVTSKPVRKRGDRDIEKGVDIALATELIAQGFNDSYEVAIVVTGDNDFNRAIRYVQDQGKIVIGVAFEDAASGELKGTVDRFIALDDIAERIRK